MYQFHPLQLDIFQKHVMQNQKTYSHLLCESAAVSKLHTTNMALDSDIVGTLMFVCSR